MPSCAFRTLPACCPIIVALLQILTVTVLAPFEQLETQTSLTVSRLPIRHPRRTADATASVVSLKDEMTWHRLAFVHGNVVTATADDEHPRRCRGAAK
jgi:hypothetical protein